MTDPFSVEDKVTIVTGGGTGIGAAIAREFARRGAAVLIASRNAGHLEPVRDEIRGAGGRCEMKVADVRDPAACDAMIADAVSHFGALGVLINNHGASIASPSLDLSPNGWKAVVDINLSGTFFASRAAARQFIANGGGGAIINLSS
ncbi:MAG: SDR family NAD(P)-dependent oxidoreductase, partial [Candidatus Binataceae bacterium]